GVGAPARGAMTDLGVGGTAGEGVTPAADATVTEASDAAPGPDAPEVPAVPADIAAAADDPTEGATTVDPEVWRIVVVAEITMDLPDAHPEIVLHEAQHPWREVRIPVGLPEGTAIAYAFRSIDTPRPLTHTLMAELLDRHGVSIEAVRITVRRGNSFFAEIDTRGPQGRHVLPCRPSDAIALVLRQRLPTPILVGEWVFEERE
ncbi:MAG TPA: bifunctional nuclease family protein, partial [Acidimicrobiales bacterium]|nr:bifunctional nuclease family protein [Acidimicrobiales bacterium]